MLTNESFLPIEDIVSTKRIYSYYVQFDILHNTHRVNVFPFQSYALLLVL